MYDTREDFHQKVEQVKTQGDVKSSCHPFGEPLKNTKNRFAFRKSKQNTRSKELLEAETTS